MANNIIWNVDDSFSSANLMDNTAMASRATAYFNTCQVGGADVEIDNSTGLDTHMSVQITLGSATWVIAGFLELYLMDSLDGTNYPTPAGTTRLMTSSFLWSSSQVSVNTTAAALVLPSITGIIPPFKFKMQWNWNGGVTTASSGNSAAFRRFRLNSNG